MGYFILLVLYTLLLLVYAAHYKEPVIPHWPKLSRFAHDDEDDDPIVSKKTCSDHDECPKHYKCVGGRCLLQLLRGEDCSLETGNWTVVKLYETEFAVCTCSYPHLFTQKYFGGNCTESVACQPYGSYNVKTKNCDCTHGYTPANFQCIPMTALEKDAGYACDSDEMERDSIITLNAFHPDYVNAHWDKKCFKQPCQFDAFSGLPLKNAFYKKDVGCVCDPTLGQFGVRIQGSTFAPFLYLQGPGYTACASIYETPLQQPMPVDMYSYFYLNDRPPVVFLHYENVDASKLIPSLRTTTGAQTLQISQEFPYDYMQHFFDTHMEQSATRLHKYQLPRNFHYIQRRLVLEKQTAQMEYCRYMMRQRHMSYTTKFAKGLRIKEYNLLYNFVACYVAKGDKTIPELYRGRYILNPFQLTFQENSEDPRFNGIHVGFNGHFWNVDFAPAYKVDAYIAAAATSTSVPRITNKVVEKIEQSSYYNIDFREFEREYESEKATLSAEREPLFFQ